MGQPQAFNECRSQMLALIVERDRRIAELEKYKRMVEVGGSEREFNQRIIEGYKAKIAKLEAQLKEE